MNYNCTAYDMRLQCMEENCLNVCFIAQGANSPYMTRDRFPDFCPMCGSKKTIHLLNPSPQEVMDMWHNIGAFFKIPGDKCKQIFDLWCDLAQPVGDENPNFATWLKDRLNAK